MAVGRTLPKWWRVYANGYDLSGYTRTIGPLSVEYDAADVTAYMGDTVKGYLPNTAHISPGTLNAVFDNTATTGLYALTQATAGSQRNLMVAIGVRGAPADGDPCFCGQFGQEAFQVTEDGGAVTATIPYTGWAADGSTLLFSQPWGTLLHANAARTSVQGANAGDGFNNLSGMATTTQGGFFMYHVFASSGAGHTATLSVDDGTSAADADMDPLAGATTGSIAMPAGLSGVVALLPTATVRQYLRWQIAFGTATSVTFACSFHRVYNQS